MIQKRIIQLTLFTGDSGPPCRTTAIPGDVVTLAAVSTETAL